MATKANCQLTGEELPLSELLEVQHMSPFMQETLLKKKPDLDLQGFVSKNLAGRLRLEQIKKELAEEKGELTQLQREVFNSLEQAELLSRDLSREQAEQLNFAQRMADSVAAFGGSWTFIITFMSLLFSWIILNVFLKKPMDPYPFILLNLILSCIAALQAPIIMMSQNRQEAKDRQRSQHDYQVNLKAEIEIRQLHEKVDHLLIHFGQRLLDIQDAQLDLLDKNKEDESQKEDPA